MKTQKWLLLVVALALIAGTAGALTWLRAHQKLGKPGLKADANPDSVVMVIPLPANVPGFISTNMPEPQIVIDYLPKDTSYAGRLYTATNGVQINNTVILMGADRTSIHKPDYCLPGQGWTITGRAVTNITVAGAHPYPLPVAKWTVSNVFQLPDGQKQQVSGLYVFWLVADGQQTPNNYQRMWWMARDLLRTGVLQRWAYVAYFAMCAPGQEDATFAQMEDLIGHAVPEFQIDPPDREALNH
jgi:hypothetical protein